MSGSVTIGREFFIDVEFLSSFSRHGRAEARFDLLVWLNENVGFHPSFSRHGKAQASLALLIWLSENVHFRVLFVRPDIDAKVKNGRDIFLVTTKNTDYEGIDFVVVE